MLFSLYNFLFLHLKFCGLRINLAVPINGVVYVLYIHVQVPYSYAVSTLRQPNKSRFLHTLFANNRQPLAGGTVRDHGVNNDMILKLSGLK